MLATTPRKLPTHFSSFLQDEYEFRKSKNSLYSLRAFARDLGISSGKLTDILKNNSGISKTTANSIAHNLNLQADDKELFLHLVDASSEEEKPKSYNYNSKYVVLADDYYKVLTEWHYFALVELVALDCFENDDLWIADRLNIDVHLVREAIERLKRVQLLSEVGGELIQTYDYFVSPSGTPSDTAKKFHKQILAKAAEAVTHQEIEERDFTSGFLRVRKSDLPYVAKRIKEFRRELAQEVESGVGHDSVYAFSIQFFRGDRDS